MTVVKPELKVHENTKFELIPHDQIFPYDQQPRRHFVDQETAALADAIEAKGQITPIIVTKRPHEEQYILICGERRWRACGILSARVNRPYVMKVVIEPYQGEDWLFQVAFLENYLRKDLHPLDTASSFTRLRQTMNVRQIAEACDCAEAHVYNYLKLDQLDDQVKEMMYTKAEDESAVLTVAAAIPIAYLENKQLQLVVAKEVVASRISYNNVMAVAKRKAKELKISLTNSNKRGRSSTRPCDQRKRMLAAIGNMKRWLEKELPALDVEQLYKRRPNATTDCQMDLATVRELIARLTQLESSLEGVKKTGEVNEDPHQS